MRANRLATIVSNEHLRFHRICVQKSLLMHVCLILCFFADE
jgi:hypothetical protein